MGTLTETVPSRAVRARRGNRGWQPHCIWTWRICWATAPCNHSLGAARTGVFDHVQRRGVRRRLRFPVGRRHGGVLARMMVLTVPLIDMQSGYRLRGLAPASRRNQMASRYLMGLALAVYGAVVIALIDGVQPLVRRDWSFTGNLWVAGVGGLAIVLIIAVIMPVSCLWTRSSDCRSRCGCSMSSR